MNKFNDFFYYNSKKTAQQIIGKDLSVLNKYSLLVIKPEALCAGKLNTILQLLKQNNYKVIYYKFIRISSANVIALWQYSWSDVSSERILLNQKLFEKADSLILVLEYVGSKGIIASEYLTFLKGAADKNKRKDFNFRSILQSINFLINYIHTSDSTDEMIREISIFLSNEELIQIYHLMIENHSDLSEILLSEMNAKIETLDMFHPDLFKDGLDKLFENFLYKIKNNLTIEQYSINPLLTTAITSRSISSELIESLIKFDLITWSWEDIIILSTFIKYTQN